jgi:hypothetical protein
LLPGSEGSQPTWLTPFNDRLYFVADNGVLGREIWSVSVEDIQAANNQIFLPLVIR